MVRVSGPGKSSQRYKYKNVCKAAGHMLNVSSIVCGRLKGVFDDLSNRASLDTPVCPSCLSFLHTCRTPVIGASR